MNKRTKALMIPKEVKEAVFKRDEYSCVWCGSGAGEPVAHFIPRSHGGLGVERNILTLCAACHRRYDQTHHRKTMEKYFRGYLKRRYRGWKEEELIYRRFL